MVFCIVTNNLRLTQNFTKLFFNVHLMEFPVFMNNIESPHCFIIDELLSRDFHHIHRKGVKPLSLNLFGLIGIAKHPVVQISGTTTYVKAYVSAASSRTTYKFGDFIKPRKERKAQFIIRYLYFYVLLSLLLILTMQK